MKAITSIAGQRLRPSLGLPADSRVRAVELIPEKGRLSLVSYVALFRGNAKAVYEKYQKFYRDATVRWTGRVGAKRPAYMFAVAIWIGKSPGRIVYKVADVITSEERQAYQISEREAMNGILHATLWCADFESLLRKETGFTILLP